MAEEEKEEIKIQGISKPKSEWPDDVAISSGKADIDSQVIDKLRPGTKLHKDLLDYLNKRLSASERKMQEFYSRWQVNERKVQTYVDLGDWDKELKRQNDQGWTPKAVPIVVPYAYATISTIVTYLLHTFGGRRPIFQVGSTNDETAKSSRNMETILQFNMDHTKFLKELVNFLWSTQLYGPGIFRTDWADIKRRRTITEFDKQTGELTRRKEKSTIYQGNEVYNQDPFLAFPDPTVPMCEVNRRGEFFFWRTYEGWHMLKMEEAEGAIKYLDAAGRALPRNDNTQFQSERAKLAEGDGIPGRDSWNKEFQGEVAQVDEGTVVIIPRELGLTETETPERWIFTIVNKKQIVRAEKFDADHEMHPVSIAEPYAIGPGFGAVGAADFLGPLQDMISWLINSHQDNVRKVLNDVIIFDPSMVEEQDLKENEPGKLIRLKRAAQGQDVRKAIYQLQVQDVTKTHIQDAELFMRMGQQLTAVTENVLGLQAEGGRKTATEVRTSSEAAASRLAAMARIISAQALVDTTNQCASNIQQYLEKSFYLSIVGREGLEDPIWIQPDMLNGEFHYPIHDGTLPLDRVALMDIWKEVFQVAAQDQELRQTHSIPRMFEYIAELGGAKNIEGMRMSAQPDADVERNRQAGNLATPQEINSASATRDPTVQPPQTSGPSGNVNAVNEDAAQREIQNALGG